MVRIISSILHDKKNYGTSEEKSKTITGVLRRKTGLDWHHIHFGFIILIISLMTIWIYDVNNLSIIFLAIGLSLIIDQIIPLIYKKICYFSKEGISWAILLHLVTSLIIILIL
jgi:hypothetical protein